MNNININIMGAYLTQDDNFAPNGVHLRWNLPKNINPHEDYSFEIFRRQSLSEDVSLLKGFLETVGSVDNMDSSLVDIIEEDSKILLQFKEPLVYLKFSISSSNQPIEHRRGRTPYSHRIRPKTKQKASMKVYNKNIEVATVNDLNTLIVNNIQFDAILLDLKNSEVNRVEFLTVHEYCASESWTSLNNVKKVIDEDEIPKRLYGVKNRYTLDSSSYDKKFKSLMREYNNQSDTNSNISINLGSNVDDFRKIIHIAATDPNMARILGLYYVDTKADPSECYDYKIVYTATEECGLVLNINGITESLEVPLSLEAKQAKGFTWNGRKPFAKVDLFWKPLVWSRNKVQPLYYDLKRDEELITSDAPIPSYMQKDSDDNALKHLFSDEPLEMGNYSYQTRSIDIFGRVSSYVKKEQGEIKLEDLLPPPPPTRLKAAVVKEDSNHTGIFSFEYGYNQRKVAPDTKSIQLYWRENSLMISEITEVSNYQDFDENKKVEFNNLNHDELIAFIGGTIARHSRRKILNGITSDVKIGKSQRQSYRIIDVDGEGVIIKGTLSDETFLLNDTCELRSAKENRANWMKLSRNIELNKVSESTFKSLSDVKVKLKGMYKNPEYGNYELCTDLDILEPDIFKDYKIGDNIIKYSTPGVYGEESLHLSVHFGVDNISTLNVDEEYTLQDNEDNHDDENRIQVLKCDSIIEFNVLGGEIAFEFTDDGEIPKDKVIIARVVGHQKSTDSLLVKLSKDNLAKLNTVSDVTCTHYAPYMIKEQKIDIFASEPEPTPNQPYWVNSSETQVLKGYIAASATDDQDNESELSLPVEVSTIKPAEFPELKAPKPETINENKGWATPPDLDGKSLVKLNWEGEVQGCHLEFARVLDSTLMMGVKNSWINGVDIEAPMVPVLPSVFGSIDSNSIKIMSNESVQVVFTPKEETMDINTLLNGRVKIKTKPKENLNDCVKEVKIREFSIFKITNILKNNLEEDTLILTPVNGESAEFTNGELDLASCIVDVLPNFDKLSKMDSFLKILANHKFENDLYSIISKVPITIEGNVTTFIDEIPGIGSNRFFYKVRLVDVADNRSKWSPCSMPVYQLDTTAPEAVKNLEVSNLKNASRLLNWDVSDEKGLYGYNIAGDEIAKEELSYKQQSRPLEQILFSKNICFELENIDETNKEKKIEEKLDSLELSITNASVEVSPAYDYIYDDDSNLLQIKGIFFYEEQVGNFIVTIITKEGEIYTTEAFDRNRYSYILQPEDATEIYAVKKVSYNNNEIVIKSKKVEIPEKITQGASNG